MNIFRGLSDEEKSLLEKIDIQILDKEYSLDELKEIIQNIYKYGYMNLKFTYAEAEEYRGIYERFSVLSKIDIEKVKKYTREEFDNDYYLSTVLMHGVVWNNSRRINESRKVQGKELLTNEEIKELDKRYKENSEKFSEHTKYLEEKYGKDLDATWKYYSTFARN